MAYSDQNHEGLTFSEWIQAAGHFLPDPMGAGPNRDCAPYSRSYPYYVGFEKDGTEAGICVNLHARGGYAVRRSGTKTFFSRKLRQAWINGEDPSEYRGQAHGRTLDRLHREYP
jgi:hypothetical protein